MRKVFAQQLSSPACFQIFTLSEEAERLARRVLNEASNRHFHNRHQQGRVTNATEVAAIVS